MMQGLRSPWHADVMPPRWLHIPLYLMFLQWPHQVGQMIRTGIFRLLYGVPKMHTVRAGLRWTVRQALEVVGWLTFVPFIIIMSAICAGPIQFVRGLFGTPRELFPKNTIGYVERKG